MVSHQLRTRAPEALEGVLKSGQVGLVVYG